MSVFYRIFGGSGYGKTSYIYEKLSECVKSKKKAFLIVPEQAALSTEREIISLLGPSSNLYVEVINFKRLCNRVFRELGGLTSVHLDDGAKKLLMLLTLKELSPHLRQYSGVCTTAEFAEKALSMVSEMQTFAVGADVLEKAAEKLDGKDDGKAFAAKLYDIALIYEAYTQRLSSIPEVCVDIYEKLCEKLAESNFFCGCNVFFDSFYSFTAREYEIIKLMCEMADNTYVTFAYEKDCDDTMFSRSIRCAKKCAEIAESTGCEICDVALDENKRHRQGSALWLFEKQFRSTALSLTASNPPSDSSIKTILCRDIYDEAKCAAATVLKLVRGGAAYSDIAICAKNTDSYIGIIDTIFEKAEIPIGVDIPETLAQSALFELVTSALEAASTFRNDAVLRYVKTGLSGLYEHEADAFESYVRTWNIPASLMKKDEDWTMNPNGYVDSEPDERILKTVNAARSKVFTCLDSLRLNLKDAKTVRDFALCIYNLLSDIKKISDSKVFFDGEDGTSLALLYECLDSFVASAGEEKVNLSLFTQLFKNCGANYGMGHIPKCFDEVRFSSVDLVRLSGIKYVILLGVNSGIFPSSCKSASLLTDSEREILSQNGITLADSAGELVFDELFLAYRTVTGAKEKCFVLFSLEELGADKLFPSPIALACEKISGCERGVFDPGDIENGFAGNRLLFEEYITMPASPKKKALHDYFSGIPEYKAKLDAINLIGKETTHLSPEISRAIYGDSLSTSYSRLDKMAGCPFAHFCSYTLRLKPEPTANLGSAETGSVIHKILEELVPILCKEGENGRYPDENEAKRLVRELLCAHLSRIARTDVATLPKRFIYIYNRLSKMLDIMACQIVRELAVTKFRPVDFELNIDVDGDVKALPIDIGDGCSLYITGQIDRVDVYEKDGVSYVRVVDYKSGKKSFKLVDVQNGFNLQMLIYLAAIKNSDRYGNNIQPAGVMYSLVSASEAKMSLGGDEEAVSSAETKPKNSGLFLDDEEILFAMDSTEKKVFIPVTGKNASESLADAQCFGEILDSCIEMAATLAKEIRDGKKEIAPFDFVSAGTSTDPCEYCDMKPICMRN